MKQILIDNAYEAWKSAIFYHNKIEAGFSSLEYQKGFVSALHNAVELFLKQIMLNNNDHKVATIKKVNCKEVAELLLRYHQASDLNSFFSNISEEVRRFYTIDFQEIKEKVFKLIDVEACKKQSFSDALVTLQTLRNSETHFFISCDFLTETEFCDLHNFMIDFYSAVIPLIFNGHLMMDWTQTQVYHLVSQYKVMDILFSKWQNFSYTDALLKNNTVKEIIGYLTGVNSALYANYGTKDSYVLAITIVETEGIAKSRTMEFFTLVHLLITKELVSVEQTDEETIMIDDQEENRPMYEFKIDSRLLALK